MRFKSLHATFGRLEEKTLELSPGLNVISGDNETGKSTWTAFIMAMLYGVDTKSRVRGGRLPVKLKYAPWSGKPMAGSAELNWQGRNLRLERSSETGPMADLTVTDTDTGCLAEALCGPDCGKLLIGAEAGVYERSGMIRQQGPVVSADPNLERRLNGLVTAVSEDYAYADIDAGLKRLQNAICYNQTGLLPRLEAELEEIENSAARSDSLLQRQGELTAQLRQARDRENELLRIRRGLSMIEQEQLRGTMEQSRVSLEHAESDLLLWQKTCADLPPEPVLQGFRDKLSDLHSQTEALAEEERLDPVDYPKPPDDPHFQGKTVEEAKEQADRDAQTVRSGMDAELPGAQKFLVWLLPGGLLLLGAYLLRKLLPGDPAQLISLCLFGAGALAAAAALGYLLVSLLRYGKKRNRAIRLLQDYGADSAGQIERQAAGYIKEAKQYLLLLEQADAKQNERTERTLRLEKEREDLLGRLNALVPGCTDLGKAEAWLQEASRSRSSLELAERTVQRCRAEQLQLAGQLAALPEPDEDLEPYRCYEPELVEERLSQCRETIVSLRSELDRLQGALEQQGDPLALEARREKLEARIAGLEQRSRALELARSTLERADAEVRARFAPVLCAKTGTLFSRLTEGRYDRVSLDRNMRVAVHPKDSPTDRPLAMLSGGTVDQLYLALRLAICELLLPDVPIVLDDALVYFDDNRAKIALQLLKELGKERQILLFTCQGREKRLLREMAAEATQS